VTRVVCKGVSYELELTLDINSEVYRLRQNEKFTLALVSTLDLEGKPDDGIFNQSGKVRTEAEGRQAAKVLIML
jgi:DNA-directed RNA polymerase I, II, and III subunit RPABC3